MSEPLPNAASPWGRGLRLLASIAIVWHVVGVLVAPISTPPRFEGRDSILGDTLKKVYQPYITALYLNHAYKFFAPNPGDSHLLRFDLYFADGTKRVRSDEQILPDRISHWPRLLYHRHFMLTEFINDFAPPWMWQGQTGPGGESVPTVADAEPAGGVATLSPPVAEAPVPTVQGEVVPPTEQGGGPPHVRVYVAGIADYLARRYGALRVDLFYRKHLLPTIDDFHRVGNRLDSPESYRDRLILSYTPERGT